MMMPMWKRNLYICWFGSFATTAGMSLVIPFFPLYIEELGVHETAKVEQWAGIAFGATFLLAAIVSPIWGRLADQYGRKLMLMRASLGMAIVMAAMGWVHNVYELVALRFFMGAVSGYISAAITLVATQTPKEHAGWALGTLSTGQVGGTLLGPLIGGYLAEIIGLRHIFFVTGGFMFFAFLITVFFVKEDFKPAKTARQSGNGIWQSLSDRRLVWALFLTSFMLQLANLSIEPIITVYVKQLLPDTAHVALISGGVVAISGFANVLAAPRLGKWADRIGPQKILLGALILAAVVFIPQAYVQNPWELMVLRFLLGIAAAGMLPSVNSLLKQMVPESLAGRVYGYNQSAQYMGNIAGPVLGGQLAAHAGIHYVFFSTSALLFLNALWVYYQGKKNRQARLPGALPQ
jgi:DHA1 family multidrug resistance protein-like MFS transporter